MGEKEMKEENEKEQNEMVFKRIVSDLAKKDTMTGITQMSLVNGRLTHPNLNVVNDYVIEQCELIYFLGKLFVRPVSKEVKKISELEEYDYHEEEEKFDEDGRRMISMLFHTK